MLTQPSGDAHFNMKPNIWALTLLAIPTGPLIVFGLMGWIERGPELPGAVLFLAGLTIWLSVATERVEASNGFLSLRRFGFVRWKVEIAGVALHDGFAGDIPILPAVLVKKQKKEIAYLLKAQFRQDDIEELRHFIAGHSAHVSR